MPQRVGAKIMLHPERVQRRRSKPISRLSKNPKAALRWPHG
jgi:hypothetical protein